LPRSVSQADSSAVVSSATAEPWPALTAKHHRADPDARRAYCDATDRGGTSQDVEIGGETEPPSPEQSRQLFLRACRKACRSRARRRYFRFCFFVSFMARAFREQTGFAESVGNWDGRNRVRRGVMLQIRGAGRKSRHLGHPFDQHGRIRAGRRSKRSINFFRPPPAPPASSSGPIVSESELGRKTAARLPAEKKLSRGNFTRSVRHSRPNSAATRS